MKHLSIFEDFDVFGGFGSYDKIHSQEIVDVIVDRLCGLSDDGFNIVISTGYSTSKPDMKEILVRIEKSDKTRSTFYIKEILDDLVSLISHINNEYNVSVSVCHSNRYVDIPKRIGDTYIDKLMEMSHYYVLGIQLKFHQRKNPKIDIKEKYNV